MNFSATIRSAWIPLLVFAAVLLAAEGLARLKYPDVPSSAEVPRNPFRSRGWPEFTRTTNGWQGGGQIYWLGNSQAFAGELSEGRIYTSLLESGLRRDRVGQRDDWQVHNWSFEGMTSIDLMMLAARLPRQTSDLVVACIGMSDFSEFNLQRTLGGLRTDLPRILFRRGGCASLPADFWTQHVKIEEALTWAVWDRCALLPMREFAWSWIDHQVSGLQMGLYAPAARYHFWRLDHLTKRMSVGSAPWQRAGRFEIGYRAEARVLLTGFLDYFKDVPARRRLVILCPVAVDVKDPKSQGAALFREHLLEDAGARGLLVWDDSTQLPAESFLDRLHFLPPGHQAYADLLQARLIHLLAN